jgi:hypothetical protein
VGRASLPASRTTRKSAYGEPAYRPTAIIDRQRSVCATKQSAVITREAPTATSGGSAIPALESRDTLGAQSIGSAMRKGRDQARPRTGGSEMTRKIRTIGPGQTNCQIPGEPASNIRADHRVIEPIGLRPVTEVCVNKRPLTVGVVTVVGIVGLGQRNKPVPVQQGDIGVNRGRGMPSQQVVVKEADLAGRVVVADIVIIRLRQRHANHTRDQQADSQQSPNEPLFPAP